MNPVAAAALTDPNVLDALGKAQARSMRTIAYIVLGLLLVIFAIVFWRKISALLGKGADLVQNQMIAASIVKKNLTYPEAQYALFADRLHAAMDGMGTDEEEIYAVFRQMQTYDDVSQLIVAYGTRPITDPRPWYSNKTLTLQGSLKDELTSDEIKTVNMILSGKNINYVF